MAVDSIGTTAPNPYEYQPPSLPSDGDDGDATTIGGPQQSDGIGTRSASSPTLADAVDGFDASEPVLLAANSMPAPEGPRTATSPPPANAGTGAISPERAKALDSWAANNASPGFLSGVFSGSGSSRVAGALQGNDASLGKLTPAEQQHLLDRTLTQWQHNGDDSSIKNLGEALQNKGALSDLASKTFATHAADMVAAAGPTSDMFTSGVSSTTRNVAGRLANAAANDATSPQALGQTIRSLGTARAGAFGDAVTMWSDSVSPNSGQTSGLARSLQGINAGPNDATATAFTSHVLASAKDWNFGTSSATEAGVIPTGPSDAAAPMGQALSRMVHPNDTAAQSRDAARFSQLLSGKQGSQLLTADLGNDRVSTADRFRVLGALAAHPEITEQSLAARGGSPWADPTLATEMAKAPAQAMLRSSGDASVPLAGKDLNAVVTGAMPGAKPGDVAKVTDSIRKLAGNDTPKVAVLPVQVSTGDRGPVQVSLFRVDNNGKEQYVDNEGRTYGSFQQWKNENRLPAGNMTYPANGHLTADSSGNVQLQSGNTPKTPDTFGKKALAFADDAALVGGAAAGVAVLAGGGWIPATVLGVASLWGAGREAQHLGDLSSHNQSIDPLSSSEARSAWLGLLANGAVGAGSLAKVGGAALGTTERAGAALSSAASGLNAAGLGFSTVQGANQAHEDLQHWNQMTPQQKLMAGVNLGFTVASAGAAGRSVFAGATRGTPLERSGPGEPGTNVLPENTPRVNEPVATAPQEPAAPRTTTGSGTIQRLTPAQRRQAALAGEAPAGVTVNDLVPRPYVDASGRTVARGADGTIKPVETIPNEDAYKTISSNRANLKPNTIYAYEGKYYETDAHGNSISSSGTLTTSNDGRLSVDKKIGKAGGRTTDIGFHHGGDQFGFGGGWLNLSPGDKTLNGGTYKSFETYLSAMRDQGHDVVARFRPVYEGNNTSRPTGYVVQYSMDGGPVKQRVFTNEAPQ